MWKVETNQKLLVSAATILLLQNTLILALCTINTIGRFMERFSEDLDFLMIWIGTDGLDIVGIILLGTGLYGFSKAVPKGDLFAKRSGLLFLFWVLLTLIWRPFGRSAYFSKRSLWTHFRVNFWAHIWANFWIYVFFLASIILAAAVYNLNKLIGRFREQGIVSKGGALYTTYLYTTYAVLNVIGVFLFTLALSMEPNWGS